MLLVSLTVCFEYTGCTKQEEPIEKNGTPLFSISGIAEGVPFKIEAGVDDYYMFTQVQPLDNQLLGFTGNLKKKACTKSCGPSLRITFRNNTTLPVFYNDSLFNDQSFLFYNTYNATHWIYELKLKQRSHGTGTPTYAWDFGNNRFSSADEPVITFQNDGIYPVTLTSVYPNSCFSFLTQPIFLTPERVGKHTDFSANYIDTFVLLFNSIPIDPNSIVNWNFGDNTSATGNIVKHTYTQSGIYKVCMEMIKGSDTMQFCENVNTMDVQKCKANYQFTTSGQIDSLQLKHLIIEWTDGNGQVYSSENIQQTESGFVVEKSSPYLANENNQQTRKLTISFNCKLSNGTRTIQLKDVKGTFAIAVPNP